MPADFAHRQGKVMRSPQPGPTSHLGRTGAGRPELRDTLTAWKWEGAADAAASHLR
jgi:hypothetical protein